MKIKFKNNPVNLVKEPIKSGETLKFSATNKDFSDFVLPNNNRSKLISVFPSIDTGICDAQTKIVIKMSQSFPNIDFISVSLDLPPAIAKWCAANSADNVTIVSDYKNREFGNTTGFLINELKLLARGYIILDSHNKVKVVKVLEEVASQVDETEIKNLLSSL